MLHIRCEAVNSSVLFDGHIPTLDFSSETWAMELFTTLGPKLSPIIINHFTDFGPWFYFPLSSDVVLSRIEVVMFNCPMWGITAQTIKLKEAATQHDISSMILSATSCDTLLIFCLPAFNQSYDGLLLQFISTPYAWVHIAELRFLIDDQGCPPPLTVPPISKL